MKEKLRVGSTFSGVGGADIGLERAGFELAWTCEYDEWKRSILKAHWPSVTHYEDIRDLSEPPSVDLLVGGFPCQDLSVAGKRRGFDGERSILAFEFLRIAESLRPRWLLLENVPGLLSSNHGRDLARLLDEVGTIGYGWAYRILDARYFGVPQRRRRVFIVARRADPELDTRAAAERALRALWEGSSGDPTPGWPPRAILTTRAGDCAEGGGIVGTHGNAESSVTGTLTRMYSEQSGQDYIGGAGVLTSSAYRKAKRAASDQDDETWTNDGIANTLNAFDAGDTRTTHAIVDPITFYPTGGSHQGFARTDGVSPTLKRGSTIGAESGTAIASAMSVRRLTPLECERLMGWPCVPCNDKCGCGEPHGWTAPPGIKAPDSKRYAACGDGIVSWVAYWIGWRIQMIEDES